MSKLPPLPRSEYTNMQYQRRHIGTVYTSDQMREFANAAVLAEREACAKACAELYALNASSGFPREASTARRLRDAIIARGTA